MTEYYAIEIDPHNLTMCKDLYNHLRDVLNCEELYNSSLHSVITGYKVNDDIFKLYVSLRNDSIIGWRYLGLYLYQQSLQKQTIVLTVNEFYSRFLHHTMTL